MSVLYQIHREFVIYFYVNFWKGAMEDRLDEQFHEALKKFEEKKRAIKSKDKSSVKIQKRRN